MAYRSDVRNVKKDQKKFSQTASKAHYKNFITSMRGGYRL